MNPIVQQDPDFGRVVRSVGDRGLGGDDRAGCAAIASAILERIRFQAANPTAKLPPAVILFLIQEEVGLEGARHISVDKIGRVDRGFNFDGGTMEMIRHGAIGGERIDIVVTGHASHAGVAPEKGVSAITIASLAIARLHADGWLGKVERDGGVGTSNVGVIQGGDATNVVTPSLQLRAEARSHDGTFRTRIVNEMRQAFLSASEQVTDTMGRCGGIQWSSHVDYEAFALPDQHPSVQAAQAALMEMGYHPQCKVADGGLDANWLFKHGIEAVTLGCGQAAIHTVDETLRIDHFLDACSLATSFVTES
ncbi:MAG: M20/M25/M40 family metallo-hydrolase [Planctomycetota bacterium]